MKSSQILNTKSFPVYQKKSSHLEYKISWIRNLSQRLNTKYFSSFEYKIFLIFWIQNLSPYNMFYDCKKLLLINWWHSIFVNLIEQKLIKIYIALFFWQMKKVRGGMNHLRQSCSSDWSGQSGTPSQWRDSVKQCPEPHSK